MTETSPIDIEELRSWIGRTEAAQDTITPRLVQALCATLDNDAAPPSSGGPAPPAIHWCLAPAIVRASSLGPDGHPARGAFLPPVPLPRRMWAGGALQFHDVLRIGDKVERHSRIADVTEKSGRSGRLCFVTVNHALSTARGMAVTERQDIVYRDPPVNPSTLPAGAEPPFAIPPQWQRAMRADPVTLFRYSALTFNGHRIHYDRSYATETELYPGLIVHGPLQATWLIEFAAEIKQAPPRHFSFRGLHPLFDGVPFRLNAWEHEGGLGLSITNEAGIQTMTAQAEW